MAVIIFALVVFGGGTRDVLGGVVSRKRGLGFDNVRFCGLTLRGTSWPSR